MLRKDDHDGNEKRTITAPPAPVKTVETHAFNSDMGPGTKDHWKFEAARAMHRWPEGKELSAEEFSAAIEAATNTELR